MHPKFANLIDALHHSFERLLAMNPVTTTGLPRQQDMPRSGIYLFSEGEDHLYVGRSNRIRARLQDHSRTSSGHNKATFAFYLARHERGCVKAAYRPEGSRDVLQDDPDFAQTFLDAKTRIRSMDVRFVEEADQLRQALLEIYVHVVLSTPYNDFATH